MNTEATNRVMSDIRPNSSTPNPTPPINASTTQAITVKTSPKPAGQFHGKQVGSGVIDLRAASTSTTTDEALETKPNISKLTNVEPPYAETAPVPGAVITPVVASPAANPINQPSRPKLTSKDDRVAERLQNAATIARHPMVQKFPNKKASVSTAAEPAKLPNTVATQIDAMAQKATLEPRAEALQNALSAAKPNKFNLASVASGLAVIAIMSGYIWTQNYPKMAFHTAASKAGFSATLPGYVPSSYRQAGPISYRAGEITISFASPGIEKPMNIVQRRTDWDSNSLRENYITKQADSYTAVQGQGLTIYLFDKNQASWVNHGVWYTISGAENLSREQILKVAYGL